MRLVVDGHAYTGEPLTWGADLDLLERTMEPLLADPSAAVAAFDGVRGGDPAALVGVLRGLFRQAPALAMEWLAGWSRDGVPVTPESCRGLGWEPIVAAAYVARAHGFFTPSPGLLASAAALMPDLSAMMQELGPEDAPPTEMHTEAMAEQIRQHALSASGLPASPSEHGASTGSPASME